MTGCDRCGAQALAMETMCPVCGLALRAAAPPPPRRGTPPIPVRRYGTVPSPMDFRSPPQAYGAVSMPALGLGALGASLIAAGVGYWLW